MKIAIISDLHDNLVNLEKFLGWVGKNEIDSIICCGDITNAETLAALAGGFAGKIFLARGNMEVYPEDEVEKFGKINFLGRFGRIELGGFKIGICHEPFSVGKILGDGDCDLIFCGHTHKPLIEEKFDVKIVNPGTLGGVFGRATFAVWEPEKGGLVLKILDQSES